MKTSKLLAVGLTAVLTASLLAGCGSSSSSNNSETSTGADSSSSSAGTGSVYYLNFKPEADAQWQELAELYTEETGVEVTVVTAASGEYETTLKSEIAKTEAPTLFQVNGPVGLSSWNSYCYDLSDSDIYNALSSKDFTLTDGDAVQAIAYCTETYGIIYNKSLLEQAGYTEDDINGFDDLKAIAEDITARSDELGFSAFTSAGMDSSSDWRFKTHLANLPIYYEYQADGIDDTDAIKGTYLDNYRQIWDLYINNATCSPNVLSTKTGDDAVAEFITGQAVFYQNGTWAYSDIAEIGDENIGMIPIYIGVEGEENQGLCTGTENYWCVNKNASEEDIQATLDFMYWCVTSETGTQAMCGSTGAMPSGADGMGFVIPFETDIESDNPLITISNEYVENGYTPVTWAFSTIPSENWKDDVGSALTSYAADQSDDAWATVVSAFVDGWATEAAASE